MVTGTPAWSTALSRNWVLSSGILRYSLILPHGGGIDHLAGDLERLVRPGLAGDQLVVVVDERRRRQQRLVVEVRLEADAAGARRRRRAGISPAGEVTMTLLPSIFMLAGCQTRSSSAR